MAKTKNKAVDILEGIEAKKPGEVIEIAKKLAADLAAEKEAHANTADEKDSVIDELSKENKKLAAAAKDGAKSEEGNGSVKVGKNVYPILIPKFQISKGEFAGVHTAAELQKNEKLAAFLLEKGSGVLGEPKEA